MQKLTNAQRAEVMKLLVQAKAQICYAEITSYNPDTYMAKAKAQPEGVQTGWLPIISMWVGSGFGAYFGPTIGAVAIIFYVEAHPDCGVVLGFINTNDERPPSVPAGQALIQDGQGSYLRLTNDGKLKLNATVELDAGNVANTLHALVTDAFESVFNSHTHPDPQGGNTSPPTQQMTSAHLTSVLKAN